jgi:hypothetical protein
LGCQFAHFFVRPKNRKVRYIHVIRNIYNFIKEAVSPDFLLNFFYSPVLHFTEFATEKRCVLFAMSLSPMITVYVGERRQ